MRLSPLYHWAPTSRRDAIRAEGLRPYSDPTVCSGDVRYPYLCLSPSPSCAWALSGDMDWVSEIEDWDLWQVELSDSAEGRVRSNFGTLIEEIKVYTPIAADCVWFVGSRTQPFAEPKAST